MSFQSEGDIVSLVVSLHHVQITVPQGSENAARDFYCNLLGLSEIERPQKLLGRGGFWLDLNGTQVHVGTEEGIDRRRTKAHLAYEVGDLDAARRLLESAGFETSKGTEIPGISRFECRDPFGNRLEFVQRLE